ncbi:hypothetical protein PHAMO_380031 [Magnetospirillum molischianum DSM 120]|uniref:Uncharacterized protein n=1 Tax=Magnetospirillum molischianum DSM 120 TaxID=1150626 RepID=H8FVH5_MAGML|nr:hypothetical protein PHAMO_380031 [Magnetospirillum molischianum DSM 120]
MVPREVLHAVRPVAPDAAPGGAFPRAGTKANILSRDEVLKSNHPYGSTDLSRSPD